MSILLTLNAKYKSIGFIVYLVTCLGVWVEDVFYVVIDITCLGTGLE